jgi:putative DNA primase/helicase
VTEKAPKQYKPLDLVAITRIPSELANLSQWVCWGPRGKGQKSPINPTTGGLAQTTNSATWGSLAAAVQRYSERGQAEQLLGIGFVFSATDPYTGIDLDACRDPATGVLTELAQKIIDRISSYTEASPSGTGVHIIARASIPRGGKRAEVEMYSHSRYFCFTGQVVGERYDVRDAWEAVNALHLEAFGKADQLQAAKPADDDENSDPLLARVRGIPDNELLEIIAKADTRWTELMAGALRPGDGSGSAADHMASCILAQYTRCDRKRMDHIFRNTPLYRQKWDARNAGSTYGQRTITVAIKDVLGKRLPLYNPSSKMIDPTRLTDYTNAQRFMQLTNGNFRHVSKWNTWLQWNGVYWQRGMDTEMLEAAQLVGDELWDLSRVNKDFKELARWAKETDGVGRKRAIEWTAKQSTAIKIEQLDQHPHLLACGNGVVDMRTSSLQIGQRTDWMTRGVEWDYVPEAACPLFDNFMEEIMCGDNDMIEYAWRVLGYCLTGETGARAFFVLHGHGRNGKTTLTKAVQTLMGMKEHGLAQMAKFETFLQAQRTSQGADPDIASLAGARVVVASEVNPGNKYRLDSARIKQFTGEDWIKARQLYCPEFTFRPICKIFLVVNHIPHIDDSAVALYDRLHYIPFNYRVPDDKVDPYLDTKLLGEMEGILAKAVRYAAQWYETSSLLPPPAVLQAREKIAAEMDTWQGFWDLCVFDKGELATHTALYSSYIRLCETDHVKNPRSSRALSKALAQRGLEQCRHGAGSAVAWRGIGLRSARHDDKDQPPEMFGREPGDEPPDEV